MANNMYRVGGKKKIVGLLLFMITFNRDETTGLSKIANFNCISLN